MRRPLQPVRLRCRVARWVIWYARHAEGCIDRLTGLLKALARRCSKPPCKRADEHLGYDRHAAAGRGSGNSRKRIS